MQNPQSRDARQPSSARTDLRVGRSGALIILLGCEKKKKNYNYIQRC